MLLEGKDRNRRRLQVLDINFRALKQPKGDGGAVRWAFLDPCVLSGDKSISELTDLDSPMICD